jgi:S-adenosylmethionine:tRNA ribosyltransferase-isomerase
MNDSRVIPARLFGIKENEYGNGAAVEFVLLKLLNGTSWETLVRPGKRARPGAVFRFGDGEHTLFGKITDIVLEGNRIIKFSKSDGEPIISSAEFYNILEHIGQMPLPPYITEKLRDNERYQTVYSHELGSAAAPTAGLHFMPDQIEHIRQKGINTAFVTLHVGLGTFRPVKEDNILDHKMHSEHYYIPPETAKLINETKESGGRVICVGTTSCRTLESAYKLCENGHFTEMSADTDIFIYPGYEFKVMDGLITNFHLPESTLIMLVAAFLGYEKTIEAYNTAVEECYRFFSFGDAMLIL